MEFKKTVGISEKAFIEYQVIAPDHTLVRKIIGTLIILVGVGFYVGRETGLVNTIYTIATVSALYIFLITYANKFATRIFSKRNYKKNNISSLKLDLKLNSEGLFLSVDQKLATYKWSQFKDILVTNNGFYFYVSINSALIIDLQETDENQQKTILHLIKDYKLETTKFKDLRK